MKLLNRGVKSLMTMSPSAQYIDAIPFGLRMQNYTRSTQPFCVVMKKLGKYIQVDYFSLYLTDIHVIADIRKLCLLMVYSAFKSNQT